MEQKEKKLLITVIVILIFIIVAMGGYIVYDKLQDQSVTESTTNDKKSNNTNVEESSIVEEQPIDLTKSLNTSDITYSKILNPAPIEGVTLNVNTDKKSATLSVDWNVFGKYLPNIAENARKSSYKIIGFSKDIEEAMIGETAQDPKGTILYFRMSDGTVEYTYLFNKDEKDFTGRILEQLNAIPEVDSNGLITDYHFEVKGQVPQAKDVIKLYNVSASSSYGWKTAVGATRDGSFYDLGAAITNGN